MKTNKLFSTLHKKIIFFFSLLLLFGVLMPSMLQSENSMLSPSNTTDMKPLPLAESTAIHIDGFNASIQWDDYPQITGSGTEGDPYLIKDLHIDAWGVGDCIFIENTNAHFRIENCTLHNTTLFGYAIRIEDASNGVIFNNTMYDTYYGVNAYNVNNIWINQNNMSYNHYGLRVGGNNYNITNNIIHHNSYNALRLHSGSNSIIFNNTITEHNDTGGGYNGIEVDGYTNLNITENYVLSTRYHGITVTTSSNINIGNNTFIDNKNGMVFTDCTGDLSVFNNSVSDPLLMGIDIDNSYGIDFSNNSIQGEIGRAHV